MFRPRRRPRSDATRVVNAKRGTDDDDDDDDARRRTTWVVQREPRATLRRELGMRAVARGPKCRLSEGEETPTHVATGASNRSEAAKLCRVLFPETATARCVSAFSKPFVVSWALFGCAKRACADDVLLAVEHGRRRGPRPDHAHRRGLHGGLGGVRVWCLVSSGVVLLAIARRPLERRARRNPKSKRELRARAAVQARRVWAKSTQTDKRA